MGDFFVQLLGLPDELLIIIFKKLNNLDLLYSLTGTNTRFDNILRDPVFTSSFALLRSSVNDVFYPLSVTIIDRFCSQILPPIAHNVKWLHLESLSIERILLAAEYSNLCGLGLYNVNEKTTIRFFIDNASLSGIYKNQISSLVIAITDNRKVRLKEDTITTICAHVFTVFTNLHYLNFHSPSHVFIPRLSFENKLPTFFSLTLMELHVSLSSWNDCLDLLDGRFNQLRTLYVNINSIIPPLITNNNKEKLPNLRCFSLTCYSETSFYDALILPLLHRMSNLETLSLYLALNQLNEFIDGNNLKKNIINHMSRLKNFGFNIRSIISLYNQINLPSNEEIQHTFTSFTNNQVISCVDYFQKKHDGQCHIYSPPYTMRHYENITNNFPGGLFECVREISLFDERPFEHEFFIRIAEAFPFIEKLSLKNRKPQKLKQSQILKGDNVEYSIIKYPHLNYLELIDVHKDYVEMFLDHTKTFLPNNISLGINYHPLRKATHNFKRDAMRMNCAKLNELWIYDKCKMSQYFKIYFPQVKRFERFP